MCLVWCSPYMCMFFCYSQDTKGLGRATVTHVVVAGPKDRAAQLPPCGQAVQHKERYHHSACILVLHRHIYAPNVSLSLDITTSSSADKDLLWGYAPFLCGWQVGMEVSYKYTLVWSGSGARSGLIFHPEQTTLLCSKLFLKRISSIKKTTTAQLLKNTIVIVHVGFGWAVEIDLRVNHFSLFLPSLAWVVCRPWPFLSLKENKVVYGRGQHFKLVEFNCTNDIELTRKDRGFGGHRLHRSWLGFSLCDGTWHQNELNNRLKDYWGRAECKSKISRSFLS